MILAFAGSNSSTSINHKLVSTIADSKEGIEVIKLTDYEIPIYSMDIETEKGIPAGVKDLDIKLQGYNELIISVAEHNGNLTAFFKNILDWLSRNNRNFLEGKKILLLGASPGQGAAGSARAVAEKTLPYFKGEVIKSIGFPTFQDKLNEDVLDISSIIEEINF